MLRVPLHKIEEGMTLARPVPLPGEPRRYLLQRNTRIEPSMVPRLRELGVYEVWVHYSGLEFLQGIIDEGLGERQREVYGHVRQNFESIMTGSAPELDIARFTGSISELFDFLKSSNCGNVMLQKLDAFDDYLLSHSTNTCYLALLLGIRLERYLIAERSFKSAKDAKDLQLLGLGMLLHDVGKMRIDSAILHKPGKLTSDEMAEMRRHPQYGYEMTRRDLPASAAQVVLNHHQRFDGRGYPGRFMAGSGEPLPPMQGKQIPIFCRIATVCDIYDAATTKRCYSEAKLPVRALWEMRTQCKGAFDPVVEQAFYEIIPPFAIGQAVTLSNGMEAAVVDFNAERPFQPKVQGLKNARGERFADPASEEIDLAIHDDVHIVAVDGQDVRQYQVLAEPEFVAS